MKYNNPYDQNYYHNGCGPVPYEEPKQWEEFFGSVADNIIKTLNPKTVLDVGCAMGYLVAALRDRGVEAYGIDVSEYAISKIREDIRPYCKIASALEPLSFDLPQHYDLITTIEVAEHLYEEDCNKFIENLCKYSDCIIFSSTPDDFKEKTHYNVQQGEYWCGKFAKHQFYSDLKALPIYITPHAKKFIKKNDTPQVIENYEYLLRINDLKFLNEKTNLNDLINKVSDECEKAKQEIKILVDQSESIINMNEKLNEKYDELNEQYDELNEQLFIAQNNYLAIINSRTWKASKIFRVFSSYLKKILKSNRITKNICKGLLSIKNIGVRATLKKIERKIAYKSSLKHQYNNHELTKKEIDLQKGHRFSKNIKFSILVPLYNTPEKFLKEMIDSVKDQTYQFWELCLADGSDSDHRYVGEICEEYTRNDLRIVYKKLEKNDGISENTNRCIEMSSGEYFGLLDHDDILHQAALFEVMQVISDRNADFIYTDENTFSETPKDAYCPHYKPDFAPDNLRTQNYICHFSVFSRELLMKSGMFRKGFDGSQDFDMVLRLTENANCIMHIPKILYFWRAHSNSVALNVTAKPYAIIAAKKAISEHLERIGLEGTVTDSIVPSTYKINYKIHENPLISILIPNKDHINDLEKCINSIKEKTTYNNYEIIIIENNSYNVSTFKYYQKLQSAYDNICIVKWEREFNYSAINNFGFKHAHGDYIILLNNDTSIISPSWIEEMLMFAQRSDIGAVGAKLYYPDNTVQHAGVILGLLTLAGHSHRNFNRNDYGYMGRLTFVQNMSTVTAACMMIPRHVFEEINGFDESFEVAFNDVDLCMRIRKAGYNIVWTPYAELYHYESKSRGNDSTPEKQKRFQSEVLRFKSRWKKELEIGDPYYNPNLTLEKEDFSLKV